LTKPGTTVEAVCSPSYVLHAVLRGDVDDPRTYRQDALDAAAPPSFDVTVGASDELDALYPANWPAAITVRLRSGATLGRMVPDGRGAPSVPLAWEDVVAKFRRQAAGELDDAATEGCIDRIEGLRALTDIAGLRALLTHHKETPS
jgi:2-methylcitrate dehydratase PrpD